MREKGEFLTYRQSNKRSNGIEKRLRDRVIVFSKILLCGYFKVKKPPNARDGRRIMNTTKITTTITTSRLR